MNNYTPDLDLRLAVAKYHYGCDFKYENGMIMRECEDMGGDKGWYCFTPLEYDLSFDAILPLYHSLKFSERLKFKQALAKILFDRLGVASAPEEWFGVATPADYCRAYLAAKGEER